MLAKIESHFSSFDFKELKTWTGFNRFHITLARPSSVKTQLFKVLLVVSVIKSFWRSIAKPCQSKFELCTHVSFKSIGVDLVESDAILNFTTLVTMNGAMAWQWAKEKDLIFLSNLILLAPAINDVIVDVTHATRELALSFGLQFYLQLYFCVWRIHNLALILQSLLFVHARRVVLTWWPSKFIVQSLRAFSNLS